jgi:hypothetical protein
MYMYGLQKHPGAKCKSLLQLCNWNRSSLIRRLFPHTHFLSRRSLPRVVSLFSHEPTTRAPNAGERLTRGPRLGRCSGGDSCATGAPAAASGVTDRERGEATHGMGSSSQSFHQRQGLKIIPIHYTYRDLNENIRIAIHNHDPKLEGLMKISGLRLIVRVQSRRTIF